MSRYRNLVYRSTDPYSCASAFRQSGIILDYQSNNFTQVAKVQRGCARAVRHYSPEHLADEPNKTIAQDIAENTRLDWSLIHSNSQRIQIV